MKTWLAAIWTAVISLSLLALSAPSANAQQLTEAQVIQTCIATKAPNAGWTYRVAHIDWANLLWGVQNPFPGRDPGDVWVEITVSADPVFRCDPVDSQGLNPLGLPSFNVLAPVRGFAVGDDIHVCQMINGESRMIFAFPGNPCPFAYDSGFEDINQFTTNGPYGVISLPFGPACTVYHPAQFAPNLRHPIIVWGNGTGATPASYSALFNYWVSYGFVVVAANTTNSGTGNEMIACLDSVLADSEKPDGYFFRKINRHQIAASGHSQGGGGAIMAGRDPRISATVPFQPYILPIFGVTRHDAQSHGQQNGPMLLLSGAQDPTAVPATHQKPVFDTVNVPVFWATEGGTAHALNVALARASLPFLRWQLMQHQNGANFFIGPNCTFCTTPGWTVQKKNFP